MKAEAGSTILSNLLFYKLMNLPKIFNAIIFLARKMFVLRFLSRIEAICDLKNMSYPYYLF